MKHEFEVVITRTEKCSAVVTADDEDQAKALALSLEERGMIGNHRYTDASVEVRPDPASRTA